MNAPFTNPAATRFQVVHRDAPHSLTAVEWEPNAAGGFNIWRGPKNDEIRYGATWFAKPEWAMDEDAARIKAWEIILDLLSEQLDDEFQIDGFSIEIGAANEDLLAEATGAALLAELQAAAA
jgi:hypothetical protein